MRLKLICCEVFYREACLLIANSPHTCDVEFLPRGLHDLGSEKMLARLQERIDAAADGEHDAVLLAYGLCNNGVVGLKSPRHRIVIPRAHDCIALFMGDRREYLEYFNAHPGTWYRTTGWYERFDAAGAGDSTVTDTIGLFMQREELVKKYGEENADYILETMGNPLQHYDRLTFISMGLECEEPFRGKAREEAEEKGWTFEEVKGSMRLLRKLIHGEWDDDFLVLQPGETVCPSHDDGVIKPEPCGGCAGGGRTEN